MKDSKLFNKAATPAATIPNKGRDVIGRSIEDKTLQLEADMDLDPNAKHPVHAGSTAVATLDELKGMGFDPAENLKDETPDIPLIKILPQAQMFLMPDGTKVSVLQGIVVETYRCNAWWDKDNPEEGNRPTCSSLNDLTPEVNTPHPQSTHCATCPRNQWGTATDQSGQPTKGKDCKNMRRMYFILDGHEFPLMVSLSPMSLKPAKKYLSLLSDLKRNIATVETKISLMKKDKGGNVVYSIAEFFKVSEVNDTAYLHFILNIKKQLAKIILTQAITGEEYEEESDSDARTEPDQTRPGDKF